MFLAFFSIFFMKGVSSITDFENARIIGLPKLKCSEHSMTISFESNIQFQGRISVLKKMYIPQCTQDFSSNGFKNATFSLAIPTCTDISYLMNGTRILLANVEISFHPLVTTNSGRVFSLKCVDNSNVDRMPAKRNQYDCSHIVRLATDQNAITIFHIGDSIVHEWTCAINATDIGQTTMHVTSCNAVSEGGQLIHLIDENGCIVDSELMGELSYNNLLTKAYSRAKMFKLLSREKYRIECVLLICKSDGTCGSHLMPPKCAFSKNELIEQERARLANSTENSNFLHGLSNKAFDYQIKVSSEWLTVLYNQYTNVDQLQNRYFISSIMDSTIVETTTSSPFNHFLKMISFRDTDVKKKVVPERLTTPIPIKKNKIAHSIQDFMSPTIVSAEAEEIEITSHLLKEASTKPPMFENISNTTVMKEVTTKKSPPKEKKIADVQRNSSKIHVGNKSKAPSTLKFLNGTVTKAPKSSKSTRRLENKKEKNSNRKTSQKPSIAELRRIIPKPLTSGKATTQREKLIKRVIQKNNGDFVVLHDWRLDDRAINDTEISSQSSTSCRNGKCCWTYLEYGMVIWSLLSFVIFIIGTMFYIQKKLSARASWVTPRISPRTNLTNSNSIRRDALVGYKERRRVNQGAVI